MRVEVEGRIGRQPQLHRSRTGVQIPGSGGAAIGSNCAAARLRLQGAAHTVQFHAARACVHPNRARSGLLQGDVSAAGVALKTACNIVRSDRSAASLGMHVAFHTIKAKVARSRFRAYPITNFRDFETSGACAELKGAANALDTLIT